MKAPAILAAAVLWAASPTHVLDASQDDESHFPALQTTIRAPQADQGPLQRCSVLDGKRLCDEDLGDAWCRKQGFGGGFVQWSTGPTVEKAQCADARLCTPVVTITCKGVPIMGD